MENAGREDKVLNDLFFVCSVIEFIGRNTKNKRRYVVQRLGETPLARLLELADILHCQPIEVSAMELIEACAIEVGVFDNVADCKYTVPTHFDIAKVYKRLIADVAQSEDITLLCALEQVYESWISDSIDNYNSSMFYESPQYLFASFTTGKPIEG